MLDISCVKCGQHICFYQKDGAGILKRMYIDRMSGTSSAQKELTCTNCHETLGTRITYKKEDRPAYRLFVGAVSKKIVKQGQVV